jgi:hypothetical protein
MGQFSVEKPVAPGSVLSGNQQSTIELTISPVSDNGAWVSNPVSIENAVFLSQRRVTQINVKRDSQSNKSATHSERKWAAVALFIAGAAVMLIRDSAHANDVAAAILVVGGLLLWFWEQHDK